MTDRSKTGDDQRPAATAGQPAPRPAPEAATGQGEPPAEAAEAAPAPSEPTPEERIEALQAENDRLRNELLYLRAELENFKKRTEKRYREALEFASEPVLREFLGVLDNLERAVEHGRESGPGGHEALLEGLGHVIQQFGDVLRAHGVEPVPAEGARFDPGLHEAMLQVPGEEDGKVGGVFEKGYTLKGRLLRPAKVAVTKVAPEGGDG
ncbi:MAG: hypothetical protein Kow0092_13120 [Deferrisomatales bacterium]